MNQFVKHLLMWASGALLLTTSACSDNEEPSPTPPVQKELSFTFETGDVTHNTVRMTITPSESEMTYYANLYLASEVVDDQGVAVATAAMADASFVSSLTKGTQRPLYSNLEAETTYCLVAFGYDATQQKMTSEVMVSNPVKTTAAPDPVIPTESFELEVKETTWRDALICVTPTIETKYICGVYDKTFYQEHFANNPDQIIEKRMNEWKAQAEEYKEYGYTEEWPYYMGLEQKEGMLDLVISEMRLLHWGAEYVFYVFGMDDEGVATTSTQVIEFSTLSPATSQNSFVITIDSNTTDLLNFTVSCAIEEESYFVTIQRTDYLANYGPDKSHSYDEMLYDLMSTYSDESLHSRFIYGGTQSLTNTELGQNLNSANEYQIMVCGFDNGPSTDLFFSEPFQPGKNDQEEEKITFSYEFGEVTSSSAVLKVYPSKSDKSYYAGIFIDEELINNAEEKASEVIAQSDFKSLLKQGEQEVLFTELNPETTYRCMIFGYNEEKEILSSDIILTETLTTLPDAPTESFELTLTDITWRDAYLTVNPLVSTKYIFGVVTQEEFENKMGSDPNQIIQARIAEWKASAEEWKDYGYNDPWQYYMALELNQGENGTYVSDIKRLNWATKAVAYAFGMDEQGNPTTDVMTTTFETLAPTPSENQLSISVTSTTTSSIHFTVNATNNDPYFVTIQSRDYLEANFLKDGVWDQEKMVQDLANNYSDSINDERFIYEGTQELSNTNTQQKIDTKERYIVLFGFENGPTTEVILSEPIQPGTTAAE